jgi:hypothetical protein
MMPILRGTAVGAAFVLVLPALGLGPPPQPPPGPPPGRRAPPGAGGVAPQPAHRHPGAQAPHVQTRTIDDRRRTTDDTWEELL